METKGNVESMKTSACLETLYTDLPFAERIRAAKKDGFDAIEFWDRRNKDLDEIKRTCEETGMVVSTFNGGAEISMIDPSTTDEYIAYLRESVKAAKKLNARCLTVLSNGLGDEGKVINPYDNLSDTVKTCTMFRTLMTCAKIAEENNIIMNLEPLNIVAEHVGNFLQKTQVAAEMIRLINSPNLKVLFDAYHMYLNGENLVESIHKYGDTFGHIHVADAPGRNEPGTGEIDYSKVYAALEEIGYTGYVGFECTPKTTNEEAIKAIMTIR